LRALRTKSQTTTCPSCKELVVSTVEYTTSQEPAQPIIPPEPGGSGSSKTKSSRGSKTPYSGGVEHNEHTPLLKTPDTYGGMPQVHPSEEVPLRALRTKSQTTTCPSCKELVVSTVEYTNGFCTWITCMFCIRKSKNVTHSCPRCGEVMARYSRFLGKVLL